MGAALDTARAATDALEAQDWGQLRQILADDFLFINPYAQTPELSRDEWIGMNQMLADAFSDLTFNIELLEERGGQVWVSVAFEGTHDGDLDLSPLGGHVIPPSGKHGRAERSVTVGTVNDAGRVETIEVIEQPQGAGPLGLLARVGINLG